MRALFWTLSTAAFFKHDASETPSVSEESCLLGCDTRSYDAQFLYLQVGVKPTRKKLPKPDNEGTTLLQNTGKHLPNNTSVTS
jgi:hypothetical protein